MHKAHPWHGDAMHSRTVRILMVCLGNICRSPTAEGVLRHAAQAAPQLDLEIDSAGTGDYHVGAAPDARAVRAARARGIDLSELRARQVTRADFERFDLVLAMDRANLRALERLRPADSRAQLKLFMDYAPQLGVREIPDPYTGPAAGFERVLDLTAAAAQGLLSSLQEGAQQPEEGAG
jgi:protein-tyrosine phosphatase